MPKCDSPSISATSSKARARDGPCLAPRARNRWNSCSDSPHSSPVHLIRFHGVLAPNAKLRPAIIPSASTDANAPAPDQAESPHPSPLARMSWARLLKRVFDIDLEHLPKLRWPIDDHRGHP